MIRYHLSYSTVSWIMNIGTFGSAYSLPQLNNNEKDKNSP